MAPSWTHRHIIIISHDSSVCDVTHTAQDTLNECDRGTPTLFLSHTWSQKLLEFCKLLRTYVEAEAIDQANTFAWLDVIAVSP